MREGDLPSTFLLLWICHEVPTAFWSWNSAKMLYGSGFNNNPKMQSNAYSGFPSYNGEGKYHFCTIYTGSERKKQPRSVRFFYQKAVLQLLLIPPNQTLHFSNIRKGPPNTGRRDRPPPGTRPLFSLLSLASWLGSAASPLAPTPRRNPPPSTLSWKALFSQTVSILCDIFHDFWGSVFPITVSEPLRHKHVSSLQRSASTVSKAFLRARIQHAFWYRAGAQMSHK